MAAVREKGKEKSMYRLIAFDMDGTLLRSDKTISDNCLSAIREALDAGRQVAICTGRPIAETRPYYGILKDVRYYICECGAVIYDRMEQKVIRCHKLSPEAVRRILEVIPLEEMMPQPMIDGVSYVNAADVPRMRHFNMSVYQKLYEQVAVKADDVCRVALENISNIDKFNLYHTTVEGRARTRRRLADAPVDCTYSEISSLEVSVPGVTKGSGLLDLAAKLGIAAEETIGVGDAENDVPMIRSAGLGIAMSNGFDSARNAADVIAPDNDSDGCAWAIRRYLLG